MQELLNVELPDRKYSLISVPKTAGATQGMMNQQQMMRLQQQFDDGKTNNNFFSQMNNQPSLQMTTQ